MHNSQDSADIRQPYIRLLEKHTDQYQWVRYRTAMQTFDASTDTDWASLELILAGLDALYYEWSALTPDKPSSTFGRVARVEFISKQDTVTGVERRGAVLFDNYRRPLLHASNALLGYGGSGPGLSMQILTALGVPEMMFREVNSSVTHHNYDNVVFSREASGIKIEQGTMFGGVYRHDLHAGDYHITQPGERVADNWTWWLA